MSKRVLAATDRRRQAGHKRPRHAGTDEEDGNGAAKSIAHLFTDRKRPNGNGKRAD